MSREIDEQVLHDHIVELLRREYYNYPSPEHPHLLTFVNHPATTRAVRDAEGNDLFPDIVVLQPDINMLAVVAEVETKSTVTPDEAQEWSQFAGLGARLYLIRAPRPGRGGGRAVQRDQCDRAD